MRHYVKCRRHLPRRRCAFDFAFATPARSAMPTGEARSQAPTARALKAWNALGCGLDCRAAAWRSAPLFPWRTLHSCQHAPRSAPALASAKHHQPQQPPRTPHNQRRKLGARLAVLWLIHARLARRVTSGLGEMSAAQISAGTMQKRQRPACQARRWRWNSGNTKRTGRIAPWRDRASLNNFKNI